MTSEMQMGHHPQEGNTSCCCHNKRNTNTKHTKCYECLMDKLFKLFDKIANVVNKIGNQLNVRFYPRQ